MLKFKGVLVSFLLSSLVLSIAVIKLYIYSF